MLMEQPQQACLSETTILWSQVIETLPSGIVLIDTKGLVNYCNQVAVDFLGDHIVGMSWYSVIQQSFSPQADDGHEISLKDGRRLHVRIASLGAHAGEIIVLNDLTMTREFERERARETRLQEMGEMIAHLAHQIRTPLASAMLYVDNLLRFNLSNAKKIAYLEKIQGSHRNIEQQIQDLLFFAKGGESLLQATTIESFIKDIKDKMQAKTHQHKGCLVVDTSCHDAYFVGHIETLKGAICNLIDNAFNASASRVYFTVHSKEDDLLVFNVIDDGEGMDELTLENSRRPFYTTRAKGTGLGLAVVDAVVKTHHGELKILSKKNVGSTFSIQIPWIKKNVRS